MSGGWRALVCVVVLAGAGCHSTAAALVVTPPEPPPGLGDDVFVQASGRGATEDQAYAAAQRALADAVLGDARWAELVSIDVHRRDGDPQLIERGDGEVEVALGLSRTRAAATLSAFEHGEPVVQGPPAWHDVQLAYLRAHVASHACARRIALFSSTCETDQTAEADAAMAELQQGLVLVSAYPDGVPVDVGGRPMRGPAVFVLWRGVPLAGMPVRLEAPAEVSVVDRRVLSDGQGQARFSLGHDAVLASVKIVVDGDALLGPSGDQALAAEVTLDTRPVANRRWGLVVSHDGATSSGKDAAVAQIVARMEEAGLGAPASMDDAAVQTVLTTDGDGRGRALASLADTMSGRIDRLFVLSYQSRFASRMGGSRVWYEAHGSLEVRDAWTGQVLLELRERVEADGVGDTRADTAARRKLASALIDQALATLSP